MIADKGKFGWFAYYCWAVGLICLLYTSPAWPRKCSAMARWPELEMGRNSARPWIRPSRMDDSKDNGFNPPVI